MNKRKFRIHVVGSVITMTFTDVKQAEEFISYLLDDLGYKLGLITHPNENETFVNVKRGERQ